MTTPRLDRRLTAIASMVGKTQTLADIGCDHGYLSAALLTMRAVDFVYATDLHSGPLQRAEATFLHYHVAERVALIQCDGLAEVPHDVETVAIAGMGGETIQGILQNAPWIKNKEKRLILQPMSKESYLREWLYWNGFTIIEEKKIVDKSFCYAVLKVKFSGQRKEITPLQSVAGLFLPSCAEDFEYLKRKIKKYRTIVRARRSSSVQSVSFDEQREILEGLETLYRLGEKE